MKSPMPRELTCIDEINNKMPLFISRIFFDELAEKNFTMSRVS